MTLVTVLTNIKAITSRLDIYSRRGDILGVAMHRRSTGYKKLMALFNAAGLGKRSARLYVASRILKKRVTSFTELESEELSTLLEHLKTWEMIETERRQTLPLGLAPKCVVSDNKKDTIRSRNSINQRSEYMEQDNSLDINEENYKINNEYFAQKINSAVKGIGGDILHLSVNHGRLPNNQVIPSPSPSLGLILGAGGVPRGKVYHIWGKKHGGKSMFSYSLIAQAQSVGMDTVLIDTESAATGGWMEDLGVDTKKLTLLRPNNLEETGQILRQIADTGALIVVDSVPAAQSAHEVERNLSKDSTKVGGTAQLWSQILSTIRAKMVKHGTTLVLVNQVRKNFDAGYAGDPYKPFGSEAIQHNADFSAKMAAVSEKNKTLKDNGYKVSRLYVDKNRFTGMMDTIDLTFKPGRPYQQSIDLVRISKKKIDTGNDTTYADLSYQALAIDKAADPENPKNLVSKKNRYSVCVDPTLMSAIRVDDPNFDMVDIEPAEGYTGNDIPDVDEENYEFFTLPQSGELSAARWLTKHPETRDVIIERMYNGLNRRHEFLSAD